jgi:hypothetical protein
MTYNSYLCYNTSLRDEQTIQHEHMRNYSLYCINERDLSKIKSLSNVVSKHLLMNMNGMQR